MLSIEFSGSEKSDSKSTIFGGLYTRCITLDMVGGQIPGASELEGAGNRLGSVPKDGLKGPEYGLWGRVRNSFDGIFDGQK